MAATCHASRPETCKDIRVLPKLCNVSAEQGMFHLGVQGFMLQTGQNLIKSCGMKLGRHKQSQALTMDHHGRLSKQSTHMREAQFIALGVAKASLPGHDSLQQKPKPGLGTIPQISMRLQ